MPYRTNAELPERVRKRYGEKGQRAYRAAFNSAWVGTCKDGGRQGNREGCAHAVATTAANRAEGGTMSKGVQAVLKWLLGQGGDNGQKTPQTANMGEIDVSGGGYVALPAGIHVVEGTPVHVSGITMIKGTTVEIAKSGSVVKADDERQVLYVPALVPDAEDSQGDVVSHEDVMAAAHGFMRDYPLFKQLTKNGEVEVHMMGIGLDHAEKDALPREQAYLVETWLEKADTQYGDELVPAGTWMIGIHIPDYNIWESAKSGERTGVSIEGIGTREPL